MEPILTLPGQHFDCGSCTRCCRNWRIAVDSASQPKLAALPGPARLEKQKDRWFALKTADGSCTFLEDSLCQVHAIKPKGCRQFPFRLCRTPDGIVAGVSFYCSAVQANQGRPLEQHQEELREFTEDLPMIGAEPILVDQRLSLPWSSYRWLEHYLDEGLNHQLTPEEVLARPLWAFCQALRQGRSGVLDWTTLSQELGAAELTLLPPNEPFFLLEAHWGKKLAQHLQQPIPDNPVVDLDEQATALLVRYVKALLFRKFLVLRRPLLHNLAALYLLPWLYRRCYSAKAPLAALDLCEYRLYTHGANLDELFAQVAAGFLE